MSLYEAKEKHPEYSLKFYNGSTLVGTVDSGGIVSIEITRNLIADSPTVGQANSGELDATFIVPSFSIPRMAKVNAIVEYGSVTYSLGWFYIDTRSTDPTNNTLSIVCFDAMLMGEQACGTSGTDITVVNAIASLMGVSVDSSVTSTIVNSYTIPASMSVDSARDVLKAIGAAYGGSFFIKRDGSLGFAGLAVPAETSYLVDENGDPITFGGDRIIV